MFMLEISTTRKEVKSKTSLRSAVTNVFFRVVSPFIDEVLVLVVFVFSFLYCVFLL